MFVREKLTIISITLFVTFMFFLTACQQPASEQETSDEFYYKVILEDENHHLIKNTDVKLDIDGAPTMITETTDDSGFVVFKIDNEYKNKVANLFIIGDDYQSELHVVQLDDQGRSNRITLEISEANITKIQTSIPPTQTMMAHISPTSVPTSEIPTMTTTPVPPPTETPSSTPTNTLEPSPTSTQTPLPTTPIPTSSNTPINPPTTPASTSSTPRFQVITDLSQQTIYTIPSTEGGKLGILANNQELTAIARTTDSAWYLVEYSEQHDGWVEASTITLIDGNPTKLPVTAVLPTSTPPVSGSTSPPSSNCSSLTSWVKFENNNAHIYWKNEYPLGTDLINYGYIIESWQFRSYGDFKYHLSAYDANNNLICSKTFTFIR